MDNGKDIPRLRTTRNKIKSGNKIIVPVGITPNMTIKNAKTPNSKIIVSREVIVELIGKMILGKLTVKTNPALA
jgi:hypothetical protein